MSAPTATTLFGGGRVIGRRQSNKKLGGWV
jgi:hypothetical protein